VDDRSTDFTQEMMVSPISRYSIIIGKICGSSFTAIVSMIGTLAVGLVMGITLRPAQLLALLALSPLMCLSAGALTMMIIGLIKNRRTVNLVVMFIVMPQMFLSGAIIPINNNSGILLVLSRILPMTYCLDLMRAVVYSGTPDYANVVLFNPVICMIGIVALTVFFLALGTFFFAKSETNR
jgi:ABC-2 type transport system permease protein